MNERFGKFNGNSFSRRITRNKHFLSLTGLTIFIIAVLFSLFEVTVLGFFSFGNIKPNLLLILVIYIGLNSPPLRAGLYSCVIGLVFDTFSLGYFGANILSFGLLGFCLGFINKYFYKDNTSFIMLIVFLSVTFYYLIYSLILKIFYADLLFVNSLIYIVAPSIIYTLIISPFMFSLLKKLLVPISKKPLHLYY